MTSSARAQTKAVPLYGPRCAKDPAAFYAEVRRQHGPVAPVLLEGDVPAWFVCGYRELHQVTTDSQLFARDPRRWNAWDKIPRNWPAMALFTRDDSVMFVEGDEHRRRAGAISAALNEVDQFALRARCEKFADELIDGFSSSGQADLISQFALPIPLLALADLYGMSEPETAKLVREVARAATSGPYPAQGRPELMAAMRRLVADKRQNPGLDIPSRLLSDQAKLSDEEIVLDLAAIISAAHAPTTYWIGNTIRLMLIDDRFTKDLAGRENVGLALNEVLWRDTPAQNFAGRFATRDTQLGGQPIRAGDLLILGLAAANADPGVHPEDGIVSNHAQMSFGHGEHGCPWPAPELAEVIAKAAVEVLLDRLPDLRLAANPAALEWRPSVWLRGLARLPVSFTPAFVAR